MWTATILSAACLLCSSSGALLNKRRTKLSLSLYFLRAVRSDS
jgi:hypothetical protein